jgi:hypothetical protein
MSQRRFRLDGVAQALGRGYSGRWVVAFGIIALAVVWGVLYVAFLQWRARHQALAAFGRIEVAPVVEPLAKLRPPGVEEPEWQQSVADTRAMLDAVTGAGLLDRAGLEALRDELRGRIATATPESAIATLRSIWDDMERRAGPVLTRDPDRPPHPPRRPELLKAKISRRDA